MRTRKSQRLKSSLAITTNIGCKNHCSYCPQKTFVNAYRQEQGATQMSVDTFKKCIKTVPKDLCLSFSGFSEPWLNPDCSNMIEYAYQQGFNIRVNTTLVGCSEADIQKIQDIPFIKFVVHLPDNRNLTHIKVDEKYLKIVKMLTKTPLTNLVWKFHKTRADIDIHPAPAELLQANNVPITYVGLNNRAGKVDSGSDYQTPNKGRVLRNCQDFHHNILLPNGQVTLCHMDWSLKHIIGNLLSQDYSELHTGKEFKKIQDSLSDPMSDILCRACEKDIVKRNSLKTALCWLDNKLNGRQEIY